MIKLATMSSVCPDWTLDEVVAGMKRHGYQGFEPRVEWGHASGIEAERSTDERKDIRARMEDCLLYTSPSPRDLSTSRMPSSA